MKHIAPLWIWLILFLGLFILATVLYIHLFPRSIEKKLNKSENFSRVVVDENPKFLETFDLIFLSGNTYTEKTIKFLTQSYFNHIAMVIRVEKENGEDEIFLWETDVGQGYREGPRLMRLNEKLKRWKGSDIVGYVKFKGERPNPEKILEYANKQLGKKMDRSLASWLIGDHPEIFNNFRDYGVVFCSELVAMTLQNLGFLDDSHYPSFYSPEDFISGQINKFLKKGKYLDIQYFKRK